MDNRGFRQSLLFLSGGRRRHAMVHREGVTVQSHALLWVCLAALGAAALTVGVTGVGVDVLVVVLLCCAVVALERTVGDWLSDLLGAGLASAVFAALLGAGVWGLFVRGGQADQFYATAERHGYRTLYHTPSPETDQEAPAAAIEAAPAQTSTPVRATSGSPADDPRPTASADAPGDREDGETRRGRVWGRVPPSQTPAPMTVVRLDVPNLTSAGRPVTVTARVTAGDRPLAGASVTFHMDGRPVGSAVTGGNGAAGTTFVPRLPRTYQLEARVAGAELRRQPVARALLHVMP
jgi:hypothetical protein